MRPIVVRPTYPPFEHAFPSRLTVGAHVCFRHRQFFAQRLILTEIGNVRDALYLMCGCDDPQCNFDVEAVRYLQAMLKTYFDTSYYTPHAYELDNLLERRVNQVTEE